MELKNMHFHEHSEDPLIDNIYFYVVNENICSKI